MVTGFSPSRCALGAVLPVAALGVLACGQGGPSGGDAGRLGSLRLEAEATSIAISPHERRSIVFTLVDESGQPAPERVVEFALVDAARARGATLSVDRGLTNPAGQVALQIVAGEPTDSFRVRASSARAMDVEVVVIVGRATYGPVEVVPEFRGDKDDTSPATVKLYFQTGAACAPTSQVTPEPGPFGVRTAATGQRVLYATVSTADRHAIVGHGLDATGAVTAEGCVDLAGRVILPHDTISVVLPLSSIRPSPLGRFKATSRLRFRDPPLAASAIAEAWRELVRCPHDPGRVWLDCTLDALGPEAAEDPLDCQPTTADERAFDGRLAARRGLPIALTGAAACRADVDGAGRPALEPQVSALFGSPRAPVVANLGAMAAEAAGIARNFALASTVDVAATPAPGRYLIHHRLDAVELMVGERSISIDLSGSGLPARAALFVPGQVRDRALEVGPHGFTLRLGAAARTAFERGSLEHRGLPSSISAFVAALAGAAVHQPAGGTPETGCKALSALVCPALEEPPTCLVTACTAGLGALSRRLEDAFGALDGGELDLVLGGNVPVLDRNGDRRADALGWLLPNSSDPGIWAGELRTRGEQNAISGIWAADRTP